MTKKDISSEKDVQLLVDTFYDKVRNNADLSPIFVQRLGDHWDSHLSKLYQFWNTILFVKPGYHGKPVEGHFSMGINQKHFDLWLSIWGNTIDELFEGEIAERAKYRGKTMAEAFLKKIEKNNQ